MVWRSSTAMPHSLLVVNAYCSHDWCLCCCQEEKSWRMWWTICFASWQSQCAESMTLICLRCAQSYSLVWNLNTEVCLFLARRLIGSAGNPFQTLHFTVEERSSLLFLSCSLQSSITQFRFSMRNESSTSDLWLQQMICMCLCVCVHACLCVCVCARACMCVCIHLFLKLTLDSM